MTKQFEDRCLVCDTPLAGLTTTCKGCGSVYRRGELVEERAPKPNQPAAPPSPTRRSKAATCPTCGKRECPRVGDLYHHTFQSYQAGKTKEEAIERMYASYDKYPGRRRLAAREAFEVVQVRHAWPLGKDDTPSLWMVYVRKRRAVEPAEPAEPTQTVTS